MMAVHINVWLELHIPVPEETNLNLFSSLCFEYHAYQVEMNRKYPAMCREQGHPLIRV